MLTLKERTELFKRGIETIAKQYNLCTYIFESEWGESRKLLIAFSGPIRELGYTYKDLPICEIGDVMTDDVIGTLEQFETDLKRVLEEHRIDISDIIRLKPCPFCGGEAEILTSHEQDGNCHYSVKYVACKKCGCETPRRICDGYYDAYCTDEEIAEIWNQRV